MSCLDWRFRLFRNAKCSISVICKRTGDCNPTLVRLYKFTCDLNYRMRDLFVDPSDFDNSGGKDFWDHWQYGGSPFYVKGSWSKTISGGG